jgi:hypothetical protein
MAALRWTSAMASPATENFASLLLYLSSAAAAATAAVAAAVLAAAAAPHSPYYINKATMQQLQAEFPEQYRATSGHRFRSARDMQFGSAYKWYAAHVWATKHPQQQQQQQQESGTTAGFTEADSAVQFVMLQDIMVETGCYRQLFITWNTPGVKFVCLNDNANHPRHLPEINRQTVAFLSAQYPEPSEFELPESVSNGCSYLTASYGSLPSKQDMAAACALPERS